MKPSANGSSRKSCIRRPGSSGSGDVPRCADWPRQQQRMREMPPHQIHVVQHGDHGAALRVPVLHDRQQQPVVAASTAVNGSSSRISRRVLHDRAGEQHALELAGGQRLDGPRFHLAPGRPGPARPMRRRQPVPADRPERPQPGRRQRHDVAAGDRETSDPGGCPAPAARYRPASGRAGRSGRPPAGAARRSRAAAWSCPIRSAPTSAVRLPDWIVPDRPDRMTRAPCRNSMLSRVIIAPKPPPPTPRRAPPPPGKGGRSRRRSGTTGRSWLQYNIAAGWTEESLAPKQSAR